MWGQRLTERKFIQYAYQAIVMHLKRFLDYPQFVHTLPVGNSNALSES